MKSSVQLTWHCLIQPDASQDSAFRKQAARTGYMDLRFLTGALTLLLSAIFVAHLAFDQGTDLLPYRVVRHGGDIPVESAAHSGDTVPVAQWIRSAIDATG